MKHILTTILFILFLAGISSAQEKMSTVVMKNGVTVTGTIKEFDPSTHITLVVAGVDVRIDMSDITSIGEAPSRQPGSFNSIMIDEAAQTPIINSNEDYPLSYMLEVGPYSVEMVLVTGGVYQMGYDGRGSKRMNSEPVHGVQLSSFYINKSPLNTDLVAYLKTGSQKHGRKAWAYKPLSWKDANSIAESLAEKTRLPVQLITESQCEYTLRTKSINDFESDEQDVVYCKDYYAGYQETLTPLLDPSGPDKGQSHVKRFFEFSGEGIYTRIDGRNSDLVNTIRITIPASAL